MKNRAIDQEEGILGKFVGGMIRRSVKQRFRKVYWIKPTFEMPEKVILVANHHGWHDGYIMYHVAQAVDRRILDWIEEFGAFPLFAKVGGMPFPAGDPAGRAETIRRTIRLMNDEGRSLILFGEGILHRPPELWTFGKSIELVAKKVPDARVIPVAIKYDASLHERPECFINLGSPLEPGPDLASRTRLRVKALLDELAVTMTHHPERLDVLVQGTQDVNERWDVRKSPLRK